MHIVFTPVRNANTLAITKFGAALVVNGETFDFSGVPEGATLPNAAVTCDWLASDVERIDGQLHLTVFLPHGVNAPEETLFPEPVLLTGDGPVPLPPSTQENAA